MKHLHHSCKRFLALFLALTMTFTLAGNAFATVNYDLDGNLEFQDEHMKYVSLGDSMTNGYGLEGYLYNGTDSTVNGYLQVCKDAYPYRFAEWLESYTGQDVDFQQLAVSCTRAEDLNFALHFDYTNDDGKLAERLAVAEGEWDKDAWFDTFDCGDWFTWDNFSSGRWHDMESVGNPDMSGTENVARMYQESVANADVISMSIGNSNFGVFMLRRIVGALGMPGMDDSEDWMRIEDALRNCDESVQNTIILAENNLETMITEMGADEELTHKLTLLTMYTVVSYVYNYAECVKRIVELNPDVTLMVMGLFNTMNGVRIQIGDDKNSFTLDLGDLLSLCTKLINVYLATLPSVLQVNTQYKNATMLFVQTDSVKTFTTEFAEGKTAEIQDVRTRLMNDMCNTFGLDPSIVTYENVQAFEAARNAVLEDPSALFDESVGKWFTEENSASSTVLSLYLGLEKMLEESCRLDSLKGTSMLQVPYAMTTFGKAAMLNTLQETVAIQTSDILKTKPYSMIAGLRADLAAFLAMPDAILRACSMTENVDLVNLMRLFATFIAADAIGAHPSSDGHADIATLMEYVYQNKISTQDFLFSDGMKILSDIVTVLFNLGTQFNDDNPDIANPVKSVTLDYRNLSLVLGNTATLKATINPSNATNQNLIWTSSNSKVATIENGVVTALSEGETLIRVWTADGNKTATCHITVRKANPNPSVTKCQKNETCPVYKYQDTDINYWWHDGIHYCVERGLMIGSNDTCFEPNSTTTRAMIVMILWRVEGCPLVDSSAIYSFKDVASDAWYADAVRWATYVGIVTGYENNIFAPDKNITREELATILYRYATIMKGKGTNVSLNKPLTFADAASISDWAKNAVLWCYLTGIVNGQGNNIFNPSGKATRAEAATMIYRFCQKFAN